ncbi:MAG: prepilin-type N-terminal cleavage/methylation domain-containing protein [Methylococcales bacterium]|nr:prepilin-type N-terminal cleavage/methylation domain-containing protein [Methylococcales bacterium]
MNKSNSGFTLIEVLIAMSLLSIMVVLLFGSLKICADSWHKGESKITKVNEVAVVYNFFQQYLAIAKPLVKESKNTSDLQASLSFQGKSQSLQFVSSFPASVGRLGLQLFSIELKKEDDEQIIKVTITPFFSTESNQDQKEEVVLLKKVGDFAFSYFGSDDSGDISSGSWHDEWLDKNALPRLVKITIKQDNEKDIPWSDMLIALKITGKNDVQNQAVSSPATEK